MSWLILAIVVTLGISFVCSLLEALVLSTTVTEIEALKKARPRRGQVLEIIKHEIDATISAILTLNTMANGLGSVVIGALGARLVGPQALVVVTISFGIGLLVLGEVLPKNVGVVYRQQLQPYVVYPLWWLRRALTPITYLCNVVVRVFVRQESPTYSSDEEIILLAERGARHGTLSKSESSIIANALSLDDIRVSEIMTPRTVVTALRRNATVGEVFREFPNLPFGRLPVFGRNLDDVSGIVRRRDLLKAKANDQDPALVESLMQEVNFIPATATAAHALQLFLKAHQKLLVVVDEFGSTSGVVTMEDVMEHILGREIFEQDDVAVDMRELARAKQQKQSRPRRAGEGPSNAAPASTPPSTQS